jgi:hypothetical protein
MEVALYEMIISMITVIGKRTLCMENMEYYVQESVG